MSQYVDSEYYLNTFKGATIPADDLNKYLLIASEKVNELTFNRIVKIGFNNLTDFQKEKVQRAVCLHADYMYQGGTEMGQISSYSVFGAVFTPSMHSVSILHSSSSISLPNCLW